MDLKRPTQVVWIWKGLRIRYKERTVSRRCHQIEAVPELLISLGGNQESETNMIPCQENNVKAWTSHEMRHRPMNVYIYIYIYIYKQFSFCLDPFEILGKPKKNPRETGELVPAVFLESSRTRH